VLVREFRRKWKEYARGTETLRERLNERLGRQPVQLSYRSGTSLEVTRMSLLTSTSSNVAQVSVLPRGDLRLHIPRLRSREIFGKLAGARVLLAGKTIKIDIMSEAGAARCVIGQIISWREIRCE
jgi:hypothetical protein